MHGDGALTHVDGLGIYRLLALIPDGADLRRFVTESLRELATDDSPEYAGLRQTLSILLDTNMNVAETARLLFFHYNTLRYRIGKLEKILGPFTTDPDLRLTLALALRSTRCAASDRQHSPQSKEQSVTLPARLRAPTRDHGVPVVPPAITVTATPRTVALSIAEGPADHSASAQSDEDRHCPAQAVSIATGETQSTGIRHLLPEGLRRRVSTFDERSPLPWE